MFMRNKYADSFSFPDCFCFVFCFSRGWPATASFPPELAFLSAHGRKGGRGRTERKASSGGVQGAETRCFSSLPARKDNLFRGNIIKLLKRK